jgi:hypothetical protein
MSVNPKSRKKAVKIASPSIVKKKRQLELSVSLRNVGYGAMRSKACAISLQVRKRLEQSSG